MAGRFTVEAIFKGVDEMSAPIKRMSKTMGRFTRSAERGLRRLNGAVDALGRAMRQGLAAGAVAATAAATALTAALKGVADEGDKLAKQSRRLAFPIEELQEWRFVAEQSGIGADEFGKSIEKLAKGVGEARAGTGTLVTILKKANPQLLRQLKNTTNTADAVDLYIKAIRQTPNAMDKAALATAAFGRQGLKFLNIAEQSEGALKALRREQRENGVITQEQAKAAEAYNDALNSLKRAAMGFIQQALMPMLPLLTDLIRGFREWTIANRELVSGKILEFFKFVVNNFDKILERITFFAKAIAVFAAFSLALKTLIGVLTLVNLVMAANPIVLITLGIFAAIAALALLVSWLNRVADKLNIVGRGARFFKDLFGADTSDEDFVRSRLGGGGAGLISKEERIARQINEQRTTNEAELTIRDESGRAELTGTTGPSVGVSFVPSGAF